MKKKFKILFLFLTVSICFGQSKKEIKKQGLEAFANKDFAKTKEIYLKLLEKGEKTWETYTILGDCSFSMQDSEEALNYYRKAQVKNPHYAGLYLRIANVLRQQRKYEDAIINFRMMTAFDDTDPYINNMIASTYYEKGDYQAALDEINLMVRKGGENLDSSYGRSLSYIKLDKIADACVELEKADHFDTENLNKEVDILKGIHCTKKF